MESLQSQEMLQTRLLDPVESESSEILVETRTLDLVESQSKSEMQRTRLLDPTEVASTSLITGIGKLTVQFNKNLTSIYYCLAILTGKS